VQWRNNKTIVGWISLSVYIFDQVPVTGLKTPFRDGYVRDLAEEVLKLAKVDDFPWYLFFLKERPTTQVLHRKAVCNIAPVDVMQSGLERRGYKEVGFLREVDEVVRTGNVLMSLNIVHVFIHLIVQSTSSW
jgi:glutamate--cysteine ligase